MIRYALTRLTLLVVGLFVASALIFFTLRVLPGDVAQLIGGTQASPAQVEAIRLKLGLNEPLLAQYASWMGGVLRGDLGNSMLNNASVSAELLQKAQVTVPLGLMSLTVALLFAIPLGVLAATRPGSWIDHLCRVTTTAGVSLPVFFTGLVLVYVFYFRLGWQARYHQCR